MVGVVVTEITSPSMQAFLISGDIYHAAGAYYFANEEARAVQEEIRRVDQNVRNENQEVRNANQETRNANQETRNFNEETRRVQEDQNRIAANLSALAVTVAGFLIADKYADKYQEVVEWRDEINQILFDILKSAHDHFHNVIVPHIVGSVDNILGTPEVSVNYLNELAEYTTYGENTGNAEQTTMRNFNSLYCDPCGSCNNDVTGYTAMAIVGTSVQRVRNEERRILPRRDLIAIAANVGHRGAQHASSSAPAINALGNAINLANSLVGTYAGIVNSALGVAGKGLSSFR